MKPSASALALLPICQYWARDEVKWDWDPPGPAAAFGTTVHGLAEAFIKGDGNATINGKATITPGDDEKLIAVWGVLRDWLDQDRTGWQAEVKFIWSHIFDTSRIVTLDGPREYGRLATGEISGTADIVCVRGDTVTVYDLKTGKAPASSYQAQMQALGLFAARAFKVPRARTVIVKVTDKKVTQYAEELDARMLNAITRDLRSLFLDIPTAEPRTGGHCLSMYCKARKSCPAFAPLAGVDAHV